MSILEDLWHGRITPSQRFARRGSEYDKLAKQACVHLDRVWEELSEEGRQNYDKFTYLDSAMAYISECDCFVQGFRLGAKLILEVLGDYDSPLPPANDET